MIQGFCFIENRIGGRGFRRAASHGKRDLPCGSAGTSPSRKFPIWKQAEALRMIYYYRLNLGELSEMIGQTPQCNSFNSGPGYRGEEECIEGIGGGSLPASFHI